MYQAAILFLVASFLLIKDTGFKRVKISETVSVSLPETFIAMSSQDIASRHISYRKPLAIYTNPDRSVDFSVNTAVSQWAAPDLPLMKGFYKASIGALFDEIEFITDEIREIENREFAILEFISVTEAEEGTIQQQPALKNYTYAQYTIENGQTFVFTFTAPARQKDKWRAIAHQIMESVSIKKTRR